MTRAVVLRSTLTVLGVLLALAAILAFYVKSEIADSEAFADRAVAVLGADEVRTVIAEEVAVALLERESPDLVAARPLVLAAVEALLDTDSFERVLRSSAITAHGVLVRGDRDITVELAESRDVLAPVLEIASPELARRLPADLRLPIAEIRASDAATSTVRVAEAAGVAAVPLALLALLSLAGAVLLAPDRRRAAGTTGLAVAAGMAVGVAGLAALRAQVLSHTDAIGVLTRAEVRDAAGAAWDALAGDLQSVLVIVGMGGVAVWAGSLLAAARLDRARLARGVAEAVAGGRPSAAARLLRGLALAVLGGLLLLRAEPVFVVATVVVGASLMLLGLADALAVLGGSRARALRRRPNRRRAAAAIAAAVVVAGAAVGVVLLVRDDPTDPVAPDEVATCNGLVELCDRRLDQVVFAGTHNAMAAAARPGWFFANQTRPIPRQLEDGVRLLMIDPHYGIRDDVGRIRTDLRAEGTTRNRVAARLGADAVRAAERLAGRLGLVPAEGERELFLCHTLCELGAERMGSTLNEIRGWLERNRSEVLLLMLESSVDPAEVEEAFEEAGLEPYLATLPRDRPLPTLRQMIADGRRLVVLDEGDGGEAGWHQPAFVFAQTTSISSFTEDPTTCAVGRGTPDRPLLILNHWVDTFPPSPSAARKVNQAVAVRRLVRDCVRRLGRRPNVIADDFYDEGDLIAVVRALNQAS